MTLEALLAYAHFLAILTMVVFLTSEAALCRPEWLNAATVERLAKIDMVYGLSAMAVPADQKQSAVMALLSIVPTVQFLRWRRTLRASGALPQAQQVRKVRRLVMVQAHIVPLIPLAAVFLARGFGK